MVGEASSSYRLYGSESSAYSGKLRAYLRYKGTECEWITRTADKEQEMQSVARFNTLPVLVTPSGYAAHDTTAVIEALESDIPDKAVLPEDPGLSFLAALIEEFADVWLSKAVMQYRWIRKKDQKKAAARTVNEYFPNGTENRESLEKAALEQMSKAVSLIGLSEESGAVIERSASAFLPLLSDHLKKYDYIFGGRPSIADFAMAAQIEQMLKDSIPAKLVEKSGKPLLAWVERMQSPEENGPFLPLAMLQDSLHPLFAKDISTSFLPWAAANIEAALSGKEDMLSLTIGRRKISHTPIRSAARSFRDLRRRFRKLQELETRNFLDAVNASPYLVRPEQK